MYTDQVYPNTFLPTTSSPSPPFSNHSRTSSRRNSIHDVFEDNLSVSSETDINIQSDDFKQWYTRKDYCRMDIMTDIQQYMRYGWEFLKHTYELKDKIAKEGSLPDEPNHLSDASQNALELLGAVRKYMVEDAFICESNRLSADKSRNTYMSFGSTDITSDYDITLIGPDSPNILMNMFEGFVHKFGVVFPFAFDTNIYCNGYYGNISNHAIRNTPNIISFQDDKKNNLIVFQPIQPDENELCLRYALLQWHIAYIQHNEFACWKEQGDISYYINEHVKPTYATLQYVYARLKQAISAHTMYTDKTVEYITNYALMCGYSDELYSILYHQTTMTDADMMSIFENMCAASYFAIESYFTPCTINVVVMEMQAQHISSKNSPLTEMNYICSVIENLGMLIQHFHHARDISKGEPVLIKLGKYMYRIAYGLHALRVESGKTLQSLKEYKKNDYILPYSNTHIKRIRDSDEKQYIYNTYSVKVFHAIKDKVARYIRSGKN